MQPPVSRAPFPLLATRGGLGKPRDGPRLVLTRSSLHGVDANALSPFAQVLQSDIDLLNPPKEHEQRKHKRKRLVQSPNSFFMDVK